MAENINDYNYWSVGCCAECVVCQSESGLSREELKQALDNGDYADEPAFSWSLCELCGDTHGGNRYCTHAIGKDGELYHFEVCEDCFIKIA